jgi:hypothetical protein
MVERWSVTSTASSPDGIIAWTGKAYAQVLGLSLMQSNGQRSKMIERLRHSAASFIPS